MPDSQPLLAVKDLSVCFGAGAVVDAVSLSVQPGRTAALVGESGSGKTITCLAVGGLLPKAARVTGGEIVLHERRLKPAGCSSGRPGAGIGFIFQEPAASLNPVRRIGTQIDEAVRNSGRRRQVRETTLNLLKRVHLPDPARVYRSYPHELSGGMQQRAVMAMALAVEPVLLIADEPTTALDVTVQARILDLLKELQRDTGVGILLVTHNLALAARAADHIYVMHQGRVVEAGAPNRLLSQPGEAYTRRLIAAVPSLTEVQWQ